MGIETGTALAVASAAASVASAGMGMIGGIQSARQESAMAEYQNQASLNEGIYQKQMADYNQQIANQNAQNTLNESVEAEARKRAEAERVIGMQRALYGKSGVALYSGSPLAVLGDTQANLEMDALDLRREGIIKSNQLKQDGIMSGYSGDVAMSQVTTYKPNTSGSILSSVIGGVAGLAGAGASLYGGLYKSPSGGNGIDMDKLNFMARAR
jgi:hypothetical protein